MIIQVLGTKWGRERPKITLIVIKDDMLIKEVKKSMILEMIEQRRRINVVEPH